MGAAGRARGKLTNRPATCCPRRLPDPRLATYRRRLLPARSCTKKVPGRGGVLPA